MSDRSEKVPLIESFGPVCQGEGQLVGRPTWFCRLGGCSYRCLFCDSMHAVDPKQIAARAIVMSAKAIGERVLTEMNTPRVKSPMVTLSGGDPATWDMTDFCRVMIDGGKEVAIETQGTVFRPWITMCKYITISPKGPSMIKDWEAGLDRFTQFLNMMDQHLTDHCQICIKIPVFDSSDLFFAEKVLSLLRGRWDDPDGWIYPYPLYLSLGNSWVGQQEDPSALRDRLIERYNKLCALLTSQHPTLQHCSFIPQVHVLQYGNELRR